MVTISGEWTVGDIIVVVLIVVCILALGYIFGRMPTRKRMQNQQGTPNESKPGLLSRLCGCLGGGHGGGDGGEYGANVDTGTYGGDGGFSGGGGDGGTGGTGGGGDGGGGGGGGGGCVSTS